MSLISTAVSGLRATQLALSTTGHNIVNANTPGYSRQIVSTSTMSPTKTNVGFIGNGVQVNDVIRQTEKFLVDQVSDDISVLSAFDTYLTNVTQLDNLFAGDKTNLANSINKFFDAVNEVSNDPASLLGRQLLLTETQLLIDNFKQVQDRLAGQNKAMNTQLTAVTANVSSLGEQISQLNRTISQATGGGNTHLPNDLFDKRDELVRELSRYVDVSTVERADGSIDVSIGQGQPLVIGATSRKLMAVPGNADPNRLEVAFKIGERLEPVSRLMSGGELGGMLQVRREALDPSFNALGRIALAITDGINQQHRLGVDLEGQIGGLVFTDINDAAIARDRVREFATNSFDPSRRLNVSIEDIGQLSTSDYELSFSGPGGRYNVIRLSDGKVVTQGAVGEERPHTIEVDGFKLSIEAGSFQSGDRFSIQPTRTAVHNMQARIGRPEEFAFASPIKTTASAGNQGGATLSAAAVSDTSTATFTDAPGNISPPVIIRFTSPTTYDVLDYSDPANPKPLDPPLMNQRFTPGAAQNVFPADPDGTTVSTQGPAAAALQLDSIENGFPAETITVDTVDPKTGFITTQRVDISANSSAEFIAAQLSALSGVSANASSQMVLSDFQSGSNGQPLTLALNGVELTDPSYVEEGQTEPQVIPSPLTADFVRDRINANPALQAQGIFASSDGNSLTVRSSTGVDLQLDLAGSDGSVAVAQEGGSLTVTGPVPADPANPATSITIGGTIDVQLAAHTTLTSNEAGGLFGNNPVAKSNYTGYQLTLSSGAAGNGAPRTGDSFVVTYNGDGSADNRNGAAMLKLNTTPGLSNGNLTIQGAYGQMVEEIGILTSQSRLNQSASESMLRQSMDALMSLSGVNIEEEAARLIELEQHYNASARLIALARDLFDTLLSM